MNVSTKLGALCLVALAELSAAGSALAGTRLNVASLSADGQEVRQLSCELEEGGLFATMTIVGTLAKQKSALDRCAPKGAAFATRFTWKGGATSNVQVTGPATPQQNNCVAKVLGQINPRPKGRARSSCWSANARPRRPPRMPLGVSIRREKMTARSPVPRSQRFATGQARRVSRRPR